MQKDYSHADWLPHPDYLDLQSHQVDIWRISLDFSPASVKSLESTLSADESQRAARFHFPADRDRYIAAHAGLRIILSQYLQCKPGELSFDTNDYGKPSTKDHKLGFNLSHSGDYALIAVTRASKVGVDIERIRSNMEFESIARHFFSHNEVTELMSLLPEQRAIAFFNCWTRKEAYIKAQGLGLSLSLDSFDVSLIPNGPARLRTTRPDSLEARRWTLYSLEVDSSYAAAVAVEGRDLELRLWDWNAIIR